MMSKYSKIEIEPVKECKDRIYISDVESGLIAVVHKDALEVEYIDEDAIMDPYAQKIIRSVLNDHREDQIKDGANPVVTDFIYGFLTKQGPENIEVLRKQFRSGYCYYFAHMLKAAFKRGTVCWAAPFGHFVWKDEDGKPYDIEGIYQGEYEALIPEYYLGTAVHDFLHIPDLTTGTTSAWIKTIMDSYKADQQDIEQIYGIKAGGE